MAQTGRLRIGELSRRVGESPALLRAWEARYGLVDPERTSGGLRLYSEDDVQRVRLMRRHIDAGLSASEAARLAKAAAVPARGDTVALPEIAAALAGSLEAMDEPAAQAALDRLFSGAGRRAALAEVILPLLAALGRRWEAGTISVTQEHFASNVIAGRLRSLARGWGDGVGPIALLACPPGELHELGLLCFGIALRERGWRITYLGADTPIGDIAANVGRISPAIVVLAAVSPDRFTAQAEAIGELATRARVGVAGAGAPAALAKLPRVELLAGDIVGVCDRLTP